MKTREANVLRPIRKRKAVERGRKISNATVSLILSFVVTAAAQERINQEGRILGPAPVVTTPILFNTPTISISVSPGSVIEGNDATFTISSSAAVAQQVTINYSMRGSAINGSDYTLTGTLGQVTIGAGQNSATTVTLHSIADHVRERNETAVMALSSGSGYKLPKRGAKATLTILNGP